jgi:hypothetical protein
VGSSTGRSHAARSNAATQIAALDTGAVEKNWGRPRMSRLLPRRSPRRLPARRT